MPIKTHKDAAAPTSPDTNSALEKPMRVSPKDSPKGEFKTCSDKFVGSSADSGANFKETRKEEVLRRRVVKSMVQQIIGRVKKAQRKTRPPLENGALAQIGPDKIFLYALDPFSMQRRLDKISQTNISLSSKDQESLVEWERRFNMFHSAGFVLRPRGESLPENDIKFKESGDDLMRQIQSGVLTNPAEIVMSEGGIKRAGVRVDLQGKHQFLKVKTMWEYSLPSGDPCDIPRLTTIIPLSLDLIKRSRKEQEEDT